MGKEDMKLIWGSGSGPCWRAMIALEEKGFGDIEKTHINFSEKGHKGPDVMALNPRGQIPTFKDGDIVVNESMAICLYLEQAYPNNGNKLLPTETKDYAKVLQMAIEAEMNLHMKIIVNCVNYHRITPVDRRDEKTVKSNIKAAKEELSIWEQRVSKSNSDYVCGISFTLVDVVLFTYMAGLVRMGSTLSDFPALKAYYEKMCKRNSIAKSWPPHWKDGEMELDKKCLTDI